MKKIIFSILLFSIIGMQAFAQDCEVTGDCENSVRRENAHEREDLCAKAVRYELDGDKHKAYEAFQKLEKMGFSSSLCRKLGTDVLDNYNLECGKDAENAARNEAGRADDLDSVLIGQDMEELCTMAVKAKLGRDFCRAYELYKRVKRIGYPNSICKRQAELALSQYADECGGDDDEPNEKETSSSTKEAEEMCQKAVKLKIQKEYCKSYKLYEDVKRLGYPNEICQKQAELMFSQYADECGLLNAWFSENDTEEMCRVAVKFKLSQDNCESYFLYREIKRLGYPNATCKRNGESIIIQFAGQCLKDIPVKKLMYIQKLDSEELCAEAVKHKILKNTCTAYLYYKAAKRRGFPNTVCSRQASEFLEAHFDECDAMASKSKKKSAADLKKSAVDSKKKSAPEAKKNKDTDSEARVLCSEAVKAKIGKNICKAYNAYKAVKALGYPDEVCQKQAELVLSRYRSECE